ncbi:MAG: hypothetical protein J2P57_25740 [Acidimicrobiaceae bacterium]|nr:hypothetical protein [Acidimicrobiaceae bacterium]
MTDAITDDYMHDMLGRTRRYTIVLLHRTGKRDEPGADAIVWEHGRRNFALRASGKLAIVGPVPGGTELVGIGIFDADEDQARQIMDEDPGVTAGIFTYEVHPLVSFPGDRLPE